MTKDTENNKSIVLQDKFFDLKAELNSFIFERKDEIDSLVLAMLSGEHLFLLGEAGTGKSFIIDEATDRIGGAKIFKRLFTKYTQMDEVFGAVMLSELKKDRFVRNINNKLPDVHFAYIDEIFKANSSILNSLLTVLNERRFDNDGVRVNVPLITMMGASNELPEDRDTLNAFWDRLLLKHIVHYLGDDNDFFALLKTTQAQRSVEIGLDEILSAQKEVEAVVVSDEVLNSIIEIRRALKREGIEPSDRRYKRALKVIKASAWLRKSNVATVDDIGVLVHILWDEPSHIPKVNEVVIGLSNPLQREADTWRDAVWQSLKDAEASSEDKKLLKASEESAKVRKAVLKLKEIRRQLEADNRDTSKVDGYIIDGDKVNRKLVEMITV